MRSTDRDTQTHTDGRMGHRSAASAAPLSVSVADENFKMKILKVYVQYVIMKGLNTYYVNV